jgi:hypothetical protein
VPQEIGGNIVKHGLWSADFQTLLRDFRILAFSLALAVIML